MEVHYFQRYHQKENVHTSNALLLVSRLYAYSHNKFYNFLKSKILNDNIEPELVIKIQEKNKNSVPDAIISQESFKIVFETKLHSKDFDLEQLENHTSSFANEAQKILMTLAPQAITEIQQRQFFNLLKNKGIAHQHLTFEDLIIGIEEQLLPQDYEFEEILEDYKSYCLDQGLISKGLRMRAIVARTTLEINKKLNLYYDNADRGFSEHDYIGLFKDKSIRAIGKRINTVVAFIDNNELKITEGRANKEDQEKILTAIEDGKQYGYDLAITPHRYFFVDKFYDTDLKKRSLYTIQRAKFFDLQKMLGIKKQISSEELANLLNNKT